MLASLLLTAVGASLGTATVPELPPDPPTADYWVYVANESSDEVSVVRFGPDGLREEKAVTVGLLPADIDGAHGVAVAPDGQYWYVSIAHGRPYGSVWKHATGTDQLVDTAMAGLFPATMALTPDGTLLFAVNFNLHGNPVPSSVSVFYTPAMQEVARIVTCEKPHGGRVNRAGTRHYSGCVGADQLVEIDTETLEVRRRLLLTPAHERTLPADAAEFASPGTERCKPTWIVVSPSDERLYVTCNGRGEILEIDAAELRVLRRFPTGKGPYNADVTGDGRLLVATLKGEQAITIVDLADGSETRVATSQPITHGVVVSPDDRYAFISNEAIGATRGTVDVIDLADKELIASVALRFQTGGISFWKMEE